jgi:hypothetical protein
MYLGIEEEKMKVKHVLQTALFVSVLPVLAFTSGIERDYWPTKK